MEMVIYYNLFVHKGNVLGELVSFKAMNIALHCVWFVEFLINILHSFKIVII